MYKKLLSELMPYLILMFIAAIMSWFITFKIVNGDWQSKWNERNAKDAIAQFNQSMDVLNRERIQNDRIAKIRSEFDAKLAENTTTANRTIDKYRTGEYKLRERFKACNDLSAATTIGGVIENARTCGLSEDDVEFLIRFAERADAITIKFNKAVAILNTIYGEYE